MSRIWRRSLSTAAAAPAIEMMTSSTSGRGFFARRRLRAGERILTERPIVADSLEHLAKTVLATPALRKGLHMPMVDRFAVRENPPAGCSRDEWSRVMAQAASNG